MSGQPHKKTEGTALRIRVLYVLLALLVCPAVCHTAPLEFRSEGFAPELALKMEQAFRSWMDANGGLLRSAGLEPRNGEAIHDSGKVWFRLYVAAETQTIRDFASVKTITEDVRRPLFVGTPLTTAMYLFPSFLTAAARETGEGRLLSGIFIVRVESATKDWMEAYGELNRARYGGYDPGFLPMTRVKVGSRKPVALKINLVSRIGFLPRPVGLDGKMNDAAELYRFVGLDPLEFKK
ncbi:MAG: hypothetical protein HY900_22045 [Deltaproteobacteria bacterium]|nr:hypothetical protein [Deltaproteobacteria bacterium]